MTATQTDPVSFSGTTESTTVSFTGFNTALGTLTGVVIDLTNVQVSGYATLTANTGGQTISSAYLYSNFSLNDVSDSQQVSVTVQTTSYASPGSPTSVSSGQTYFVGGGTPASPGNGYVGNSATPPSGFVNATSPTQNGTPATVTTNLSSYEGSGTTVLLDLSGYNVLSSITSGGFNTSVDDTTVADVTLYYTYTPVPEPSQSAMGMIAFGLVLLVGRHYFKSRGFSLSLA